MNKVKMNGKKYDCIEEAVLVRDREKQSDLIEERLELVERIEEIDKELAELVKNINNCKESCKRVLYC